MGLDDVDAIRRFISQIKGQADRSDPNTVISPPTSQHDGPANEDGPALDTFDSEHTDKNVGTTTPPNSTISGQDNNHLISPEAQPKPSPHFSGLRAPTNTPKTAASSPRLTAANNHNEDVAEAFSDYINRAISRPLSESMWAPGFARYKPSTLGGARSTNVLTPIKAVEPNPIINDTFDRMSFKAADSNHKISESLIGDHVTQSLSSKPLPSLIKQLPSLADMKTQGPEVNELVQAKFEKASDGDFKPFAHTETAVNVQSSQIKADRVSKEDLADSAPNDGVGKENDAPSTPKANLPPHLWATQVSSQKIIKAETKIPSSGGLGPDTTGKNAYPGLFKDIQAATDENETKVTTGPASTKPLAASSRGEENLEHKTIFNAWPKSEERSRSAAEVRKVIIKDLPRDTTASLVASIVYGGPVEEIQIRSSAAGHLSATVRFMSAKDCKRFYEDTSNGLVYKKDARGRELILFVELSRDVDVVGGLLQGWIDSGITRCVRAVGVETKWDLDGLLRIAERKNRKVEKIVDGQNAGGARSVVFRFCRVEDAVHFRAALSRDEEWEHCNIHYAADPCATASGVHFEN